MTNYPISSYPVLPLRDIVLFPDIVVPLFVGREKSIHALEEALATPDKHVLLLTQKEATKDIPTTDDLYRTGVIGQVLQLLKLPDGTVKVLVEGKYRAAVSHLVEGDESFQALAQRVDDAYEDDAVKLTALTRSVLETFQEYVKLNKKVAPEVAVAITDITDPAKLTDTVASHLAIKISEKQTLLETLSISLRLEQILTLMQNEIGLLTTEKKIRSRVKSQMEKTQRDYYLNEQLKAIHKELGDGEDSTREAEELERKIKAARLSKEAMEKAVGELKKLRMMNPMSAEATVIRNYLDWLIAVPWKKPSKVKRDIKEAKKVLDRDHYGLEKVKERILEYLAVQQRTKKLKGPILCLVGAPGVGKTSLARSIAEATGRSYVRMSLGGVRDEAEIRGHRRTYIGSMPGKIIQSMKKAKTSNPLFLLDEIDKMGLDYRGDPASALLEVLDPEQNSSFQDHYLEVDYDLSDVMFIATANTLNLPRPLLDRMEIIRLSGYTEDEKLAIAQTHLLPKIEKDHGLKGNEWEVGEATIRDLIRYYTREAGVRSLERELANLARKSLKEILMNGKEQISITPKRLPKYAGVRKYSFGKTEESDLIGVVTGLAYTEVGGDLLSIEAVRVPGKGKMTITGKLGNVMQESIQAAASYVRARGVEFGITPPEFQKQDIHVHVPEGATPKDGPSAGITMCTAIVSVMTGIPVKKSVAMTGEITLRGRVLPIGGLKEKLLAALRGGIETVVIPKENEKDLEDIPANVKKGLTIIPVSTVDEVLGIALSRPIEPVKWEEPSDSGNSKAVDGDADAQDALTKH
ncbi:MAG: endopeptidase La [Rickettsiales bacterium]|jgi:ATP-dependent Lon protease|nr:endopeptidase La [Rickettsiales bacterium]